MLRTPRISNSCHLSPVIGRKKNNIIQKSRSCRNNYFCLSLTRHHDEEMMRGFPVRVVRSALNAVVHGADHTRQSTAVILDCDVARSTAESFSHAFARWEVIAFWVFFARHLKVDVNLCQCASYFHDYHRRRMWTLKVAHKLQAKTKWNTFIPKWMVAWHAIYHNIQLACGQLSFCLFWRIIVGDRGHLSVQQTMITSESSSRKIGVLPTKK